ncbi:MAG TPA: PAS domain-containing protein, partial [Polyangiaceae bacterium]
MPSFEPDLPLDISLSERFTSLFVHMHEGVAIHELVYDAAGEPIDYRILDVNPQFEAHTGLRRESIIGK